MATRKLITKTRRVTLSIPVALHAAVEKLAELARKSMLAVPPERAASFAGFTGVTSRTTSHALLRHQQYLLLLNIGLDQMVERLEGRLEALRTGEAEPDNAEAGRQEIAIWTELLATLTKALGEFRTAGI